jgi:PKHD-type hydroxylase
MNKNKVYFQHSSWNLEKDHVNFYAFWKDAFSKEECLKIIDIAKKKGLVQGITYGKSNARKSQISWLYPVDDLGWAFQKVTDIVKELNKEYFKFDIFGLNEGFQFTNYKAPSDKYKQHVDRAYGTAVRKLSISIQLTDPKEYKGGELILYDGDKGSPMSKEQGNLIIFPSYVLHEVKPVTKGERNSLVCWVTGKSFV